jgi:hypothetical protein
VSFILDATLTSNRRNQSRNASIANPLRRQPESPVPEDVPAADYAFNGRVLSDAARGDAVQDAVPDFPRPRLSQIQNGQPLTDTTQLHMPSSVTFPWDGLAPRDGKSQASD